LAPLAALAASAATERASPVDLLHPHRPPAPPSNRRTYALAAAAAACVVFAILWSGYRRIAGPREAAAEADAERVALEPSLVRTAEIEQQAAAVDAWLNQAGNLLFELEYLGQQLRPKPLADAAFNSGEDLIITKLTVAGRQITIDAAARTTEALTPIERRLRDGKYRVMRGVVENTSEATPGYAARMSEVLERIEPDAVVAPAAATAATGAAATPTAGTTNAAPAAAADSASTTTPKTASETTAGGDAAPPSETKPAEATSASESADGSGAAPASEPAPTPTSAPSSTPVAAPAETPASAPVGAPVADPFSVGGSP
jgi:hypothetical protein